MGAALIAQAHDELAAGRRERRRVVAAAPPRLTCDPVAGFVQVPCIERCAFGAVKAWTGFMIASNEIPADRRVDFDTTVNAMALTAKEMNSKYKETSEGGLAVVGGALLAAGGQSGARSGDPGASGQPIEPPIPDEP